MNKDIDQYWENYQDIYSFEEILKEYREKKIIEFLKSKRPKNILEIGCGFQPVFVKYIEFESYTIVEPGVKAYENAMKISEKNERVNCINNFFEKISQSLMDRTFDCILIPGVLHETENPDYFLYKIGKVMNKDTIVYVNVPNAMSLHRIIAKEMGIINDIFDKSKRNISLQQTKIFDKKILQEYIKRNIPSAVIEECSSFFLKPFTHNQMMECLESRIINESIIEGLYKSTDVLKDYGCELACVFKKNI